MRNTRASLLVVLTGLVVAAAPPALAQTTTLTMSSWVSPQHHLTSVVLQGWANEVEKATGGRVKLTMLPKHPSAPPGTFDAVRDGIADVQGLKIRTGGGIAEKVAKALGASAFVKPAPESYELLKGGVADGVFFPMESIVSFKLETVLEQATLFPGGMYSSAFGFFMNEDKWNKLPKQDQEVIAKLSGEHIARLAGASWDEADRKGMEQLKKSGVKIVNASPAFVAKVQKRSAPIIDDWITKAKAKGVDSPKVLAEFREELKKI